MRDACLGAPPAATLLLCRAMPNSATPVRLHARPRRVDEVLIARLFLFSTRAGGFLASLCSAGHGGCMRS